MLGNRVLLIDIDAQANLTTGLGIDPYELEYTGAKDITDLLLDPITTLKDVVIEQEWQDVELDIVPSHIRLSTMEKDLVTNITIDEVLVKKLKNHGYDFVLIDPPPAFSIVNSLSLMASSGILIPTQLSAYPIRALEYVLNRVLEVQELQMTREKARGLHRVLETQYKQNLAILGIAVSMYDPRSTKFNQSMTQNLRDVLQKFYSLQKKLGTGNSKVNLFPEQTWIPHLNVLSSCQDKGYPLFQAKYDYGLTAQYREVAQKATERYIELGKHLVEIAKGKV